MKKVFFISALALVAFSSCVKDRSCVCKDSSGTVVSTTTLHSTKAAATTVCNASSGGGETCSLQ